MDAYQKDGYQLIRQAIEFADIEPLRACIQEQVGIHAQSLKDDEKVDSLYEELPFGYRLPALNAHEPRRGSWNENVFSPEIYALINHSAIADVLEPHLGHDISFNGDYHLRSKMPGAGMLPLHQDSQYYGEPSQHARIITVWIPLVDVDESNGCLSVIPGSHAWDLIESARDANNQMRSSVNVEELGTPIPMPMKMGDILILSNMTCHGSGMNQTDAVRWSVDIRYCRTRGTYEATEPERSGEDFLYDKLRTRGSRVPMVVRGKGAKWSFEQWKAERSSVIEEVRAKKREEELNERN